MGLDMYAYRVKADAVIDDFKFDTDKDSGTEIAYWRKHSSLQGWMEELYRSKGGQEEFNCVNVRLESKDLESLELAIRLRKLPRTVGFFFGNNLPDDESDFRDLKFIRDAHEAIDQNFAVYYTSWW